MIAASSTEEDFVDYRVGCGWGVGCGKCAREESRLNDDV